jgi:hypothetical protein
MFYKRKWRVHTSLDPSSRAGIGDPLLREELACADLSRSHEPEASRDIAAGAWRCPLYAVVVEIPRHIAGI